MQIPDTPRARLIDVLLRDKGDSLVESIARLRGEDKTWTEVAEYLTDATGVRIGRESLRQWCRDEQEAAA